MQWISPFLFLPSWKVELTYSVFLLWWHPLQWHPHSNYYKWHRLQIWHYLPPVCTIALFATSSQYSLQCCQVSTEKCEHGPMCYMHFLGIGFCYFAMLSVSTGSNFFISRNEEKQHQYICNHSNNVVASLRFDVVMAAGSGAPNRTFISVV